MKIGVITFWNGNDNYGMLLQCWALQRYLEKQGHQPFVIKFDVRGNILKRLLREVLLFVKLPFNKSLRTSYKLQRRNNKYNKLRDFDSFRKTYLRFSKRTYHYVEKLRRFPPVADCYISGSDQIWRGSLRFRNIWGYFLDFGPADVKRVAYAPSFGMKEYPVSEEFLLKQALSKYDYVSCRENDGVEICKRIGVKSIKVEDPTLLLDAEDYLSLCTKPLASNYIFIYSINIESPEDIYYTDLIKDKKEKKIIVTPSRGYLPSKEVFGEMVNYFYPTPHEWLSLIAFSDFLVTTSFHGVVFSIIFNKKFAYVPLKGKYANANNRVFDLLYGLSLDFTIVNDGKDFDRINNSVFNWDYINRLKKKRVTQSKMFIADSCNE